MLAEVGFFMPDPEGWPSVFFHDRLKLLLVVYVDDFKMSGPKESMKRAWELIGSRIDMDKPGTVGRYLGCDHVYSTGVKLGHHDHPFAHAFDKSLPDPAAVTAAHRTFGPLRQDRDTSSGITFNLGRTATGQIQKLQQTSGYPVNA